MNFTTFATNQTDIDHCAQADNLAEVLLEPALLARQGRLSLEEAGQLALSARQQQLRPVLVWDALMPERLMTDARAQLTGPFLSMFDAVRVSDIGAAHWLHTQHPNLPLQLIVETGNHNWPALKGWCDIFRPSLARLILSIELPEEKLVEYCRRLPVSCEVLGVGPILLFYSPRSLLAQPLAADDDETAPYVEALATPDEASSLRLFPTIETRHGTLMFLDKEQFILDRLIALRQAGLHTVRLDLRHLSHSGQAATGIVDLCRRIEHNPAGLRAEWPRPTRAPFFKANKTTAQFGRMKAKRHNYRDEDTLAEIIAGENGRYIVFQALRPFATTEAATLVLPHGETLPWPAAASLRTLNGDPVDLADTDQLLVTQWIKKACAGALLKSK
ncbi:MAG: U32 family peptidase [Anaerolineae bacterium]|nr:U32 family peptidase [Anaerolineae bacterium]